MESLAEGSDNRRVRATMRRSALGSLLIALALCSMVGASPGAFAEDNDDHVEALPTAIQPTAEPTIAVATVPPTAVPTHAPPPTAVPTQAPPPTAVPVPTQAPPVVVPDPTATAVPTEPPAVIEVPEVPAEPVEPPSEVPVQGQPGAGESPIEAPTATLEPTPTVEPTATATPIPTPSPSPTPTPTPEPAIPFDPQVTCAPVTGASPAVAGSQEWAFVDCAVSWQTKDVAEVLLQKPAAPAGWDIVLVNDRQSEDPVVRLQDSSPLNLEDSDTGDDDFLTSRFSIASRIGCDADANASVPLVLQVTSGAEAVKESASVTHTLGAIAARRPDVTLRSATFRSVDPAAGATTSTGTITIDFANASGYCNWSILASVSDFVSEDGVIPSTGLEVLDVTGVQGLSTVQEGGEIEVLVDSTMPVPTNGTIILTVSVPMPDVLTDGEYLATITARANSP